MWWAQTREAEDGDGDGGECDEVVAEDALAREAGDDFADHAHGGQNHDVDGGMRIEPEQMLKEERIAAEFGIEDAEVQSAFDRTRTMVMATTGVPRI
jgi:hypothetical protein